MGREGGWVAPVVLSEYFSGKFSREADPRFASKKRTRGIVPGNKLREY